MSEPATAEVINESTPSHVWTIKKVLTWSTQYLAQKGSPTPRLDAELILANILACARIQLYTGFDKPLAPPERERYRLEIFRRAQGEPVAYILGTKAFYRHDFAVGPAVLIPRPETELVVETAVSFCHERRQAQTERLRILDIGTGSGCIAISLALEFPDAEVVAWDVSEAALVVAGVNAQGLNAGPALSFRQIDVFDQQAWDNEAPFDLIVSNPPYISAEEFGGLDKSVAAYEPRTALVAEEQGYRFYQHIARSAGARLRSGGLIIVEIGKDQSQRVHEIFRERQWQNVETKTDLAGLDRVVIVSGNG